MFSEYPALLFHQVRLPRQSDLFRYGAYKHEVHVAWKAEEDDDIMQELGEDFKDRFQDLNFSIIQHG